MRSKCYHNTARRSAGSNISEVADSDQCTLGCGPTFCGTSLILPTPSLWSILLEQHGAHQVWYTYSWSCRVPRPHLELFFCCVRVCNLFTTAIVLSLVSAASAPSPTKTIHRTLTEGKARAALVTNSAVPYCAVQNSQKKGNRANS